MSREYRSEFNSTHDFEYNLSTYWNEQVNVFKVWLENAESNPPEKRDKRIQQILDTHLQKYIPMPKFSDIFKDTSSFHNLPYKLTLAELDRCVDEINQAYSDGTMTFELLKRNIDRLTKLKNPENFTHLIERYEDKKRGEQETD